MKTRLSDFTPELCGPNFTPALHDEPGVSVLLVQVEEAIAKSIPPVSFTDIVGESELPVGLLNVTEVALLK